MAVEYKKMKATYDALVKKVQAVYTEDASVENTRGKMADLNWGYIGGIGERVEELKGNGAVGTKIDDFLNDAETKKLYDDVQENVELLRKTHERNLANRAVATKLYDELMTLKDELLTESAARKKKAISGSSHKEMDKLAAEIDKFVKEPPGNMANSIYSLGKTKPQKFVADTKIIEMINKEIAQSKTDRDALRAREIMQQSLNERVLKGKVNKVAALYQEVGKCATECVQALKDKDNAGAKKLLDKACDLVEEMNEIAQPLADAFADNKAWVSASSAGPKIIDLLNKVSGAHSKALETVTKLQSKVT